jgi:hypothetical protein
MPSTLGGLALFVAFLTPGFLNYIQRRRRAPQRTLSPLVEIATFLSISVATNIAAVAIFSLVRLITPEHTPNVELLASRGASYVDPRLGYVALWGLGILALSCCMAVAVGVWPGPLRRLTPVIVDSSAWYEIFEAAPDGSAVYIGCDLADGSYVGGFLYWYNTDVDEVADRDIVLTGPIVTKIDGEERPYDFNKMILSARSILRIHVEYLKDVPEVSGETPLQVATRP